MTEELLQIEANGNEFDEILKNITFSSSAILNKHSSQKKAYVRGNQSPFINNTLSKTATQRPKRRKIFLKNRTERNKNNVKKRNIWEFFGNLNLKSLNDTKKCWGVVKHLLSNKVVFTEKITLVEDYNTMENVKSLHLFGRSFSLISKQVYGFPNTIK